MADEFSRDMLRIFNLTHMQVTEHRTVAIVTAAYIDDYLVGLIKKKMPQLNSDLASRLFGDRGSCSTLANKIDIAWALGAMHKGIAKEAILIARIRNRFAHKLAVQNFDHPDVAPLVDKLQSGRGVMVTHEGGEPYSLDHDWTRAERFANAAIGTCVWIMTEHRGGEAGGFRLAPEDVLFPSHTKPSEALRTHLEGPGQADQ